MCAPLYLFNRKGICTECLHGLFVDRLRLRQPKKMVSEMSALGLKHVGFGIPTDLFTPFISATQIRKDVRVCRVFRTQRCVIPGCRLGNVE